MSHLRLGESNGLLDAQHCGLISIPPVFHFVNAPCSFIVSREMHSSLPTASLFSSRKRWRLGRRSKRPRSALAKSWDSRNATICASQKRWRKCNTSRWSPKQAVREFSRFARREASRKPKSSSLSSWASTRRPSRPSSRASRTPNARHTSSSTCNGSTWKGSRESSSTSRSLSRNKKKLAAERSPKLGLRSPGRSKKRTALSARRSKR